MRGRARRRLSRRLHAEHGKGKENTETETETQRHRDTGTQGHRETEAASQGSPRMVGRHQKLEEVREDSSPEVGSCRPLGFGLPALGTVRG